jgi:hypothetical protein
MGKFTGTVYDHLVVPARVRLTPAEERANRLSDRLVPAPIPVRLVIDTGSRRTTLIPSIINHLDPAVHSVVRVETSVANVSTRLHWVCLEFPDTWLAPVPEFVVASLQVPSNLPLYAGVIGRDLLHRWERFLLEGRRGRMTIWDQPRPWLAWLGP